MLTKEIILALVLSHHNVGYEDIVKRTRKGILPDIRSQYIYFVNKYIKDKGIRLSWTSVCQYVGYGDHTMYFSSLRKACDLIDSDKTYRQQVEQIQSEILNYINSQPLKVAVSKI